MTDKKTINDSLPGRIAVRHVLFDNVTMDQARDVVAAALERREHTGFTVFTPNAEIAQICEEDAEVAKLIACADLVIPDGAGVVLASRILGTPLKQKVAGYDLGLKMCEYAANHGKTVYFFGAKPAREGQKAVAETAAEKLCEKYPGLCVAGWRDGFFKPEETREIIKEINAASPDILFVCLGAPRQEKWICENIKKINTGAILALGGSLDGYAGLVKRAPRLFIKCNAEWLYRLIKQPSRIGRMMKLPKYIFGAVVYKIKRNHRKVR
ncbi:MAG: WecB/TagA/CpsF family glycosyltransferase [Oscillospiraceae bacterium]|nr:WecB/TagA/CpsF family glycosyltransferase [Oscillospiraceae bacterium]